MEIDKVAMSEEFTINNNCYQCVGKGKNIFIFKHISKNTVELAEMLLKVVKF